MTRGHGRRADAGRRVVLLAGCSAAAAAVLVAPALLRGPALEDRFDGPDGLVTNEFAFHNRSDPRAVTSPLWWVTSGSLFRSEGTGWSGPLDSRAPDAGSRAATDSAVFRMVSRERFGDTRMSLRFRVAPLGGTAGADGDPAWTGLHVFLRYQDEFSLYVVSIARRDGAVVVKKKVPGGPSNGGTYLTLARGRAALADGRWHTAALAARDADGGVELDLVVDGAPLLHARDSGAGGAPLTGEGAVGLRGDGAQFWLDDVVVR